MNTRKSNRALWIATIGCILMIITSEAYAQNFNNDWKTKLSNALAEFQSCDDGTSTGVSPCNKFIGQSVKTVYNIDDFYSESLGRYMLVSEISDFVDKNDQWQVLGPAYDQEALKEAQERANSKQAVVAIYLNEDNIGHMSLILPGDLKPSGSWGFQVPNSASFFPTNPENSYIGKSLSYAFGRSHIKDVKLYVRNY